jgi:predicted ester cyclase
MSAKQNKANARRLTEEVTNKGNMAILPELIDPNFIMHGNNNYSGVEGMKKFLSALRAAFPDYTEKIENIVAEGDLVAVFTTLNGTFKGEINGMKPTGKKMSVPSARLSRYVNGKETESWTFTDSLTWYKQLGIPNLPEKM